MDLNFRRLIDTLTSIPLGRKVSTSDIRLSLKAKGHDVTPRTLQRDLEALAHEFGIECDDRAKPYGWRWPTHAHRIALPGMDWPEALSFHLLRQHLGGLLPASVLEHLAPYFKEAEAKLNQQFRNVPLQRWPDKVRVEPPGQPLRSPAVPHAVRDAVTEALLTERQLDIRYRRARDAEPQPRRIHPLGLVQRGGIFYLAVRGPDSDNVFTIAMHRIDRATRLDEPVQIPEDFSVTQWLDEGAMGFGSGGKLKLVAEFHDDAGRHLLESPLSEDQQVKVHATQPNRLRITATVQDTQQLRWWLLGFGEKVEVLAPAALRRDIAKSVREAARRYTRVKR